MSHDATNWAIKQRGLKPATKLLLWQLADRHNRDTKRCDPSQEGLAFDTEMSRASVNRHLDELERRGLIRRVPEIDPRTKRQLRTTYILGCDGDLSVPVSSTGSVSQNETRDDAPAVSQNETRAVSQKTPEPCLKNGDSRVSNCDTNLVTKPGTQPRADARAGVVVGFNSFWDAYPLKVEEKLAARAWKSALDDGCDPAVIVDAAKAYAKSSEVSRGFAKKPANWLRASAWEDAAYVTAPTPAVDRNEVNAQLIKSGNPAMCRFISPSAGRAVVAAGLVTAAECKTVGVVL